MSENNRDIILENTYERGFDDGYNKALSDLSEKYKSHIDNMISNIQGELE